MPRIHNGGGHIAFIALTRYMTARTRVPWVIHWWDEDNVSLCGFS